MSKTSYFINGNTILVVMCQLGSLIVNADVNSGVGTSNATISSTLLPGRWHWRSCHPFISPSFLAPTLVLAPPNFTGPHAVVLGVAGDRFDLGDPRSVALVVPSPELATASLETKWSFSQPNSGS
ncbi:hypothetical protein AMTR_s00086p00089170 [Amborella trichopoda]|uniref:Legume lectin domain-containing protein n=1 Tax=Amborella trichopoda TaxID=13333 RepID=W1NYW3_AMBTC|nr:hypothetical protein AMTR_s00086p00089170 [Amborella trichopoda]